MSAKSLSRWDKANAKKKKKKGKGRREIFLI